jgi:hypothetical protein
MKIIELLPTVGNPTHQAIYVSQAVISEVFQDGTIFHPRRYHAERRREGFIVNA